MRKLGKGKSVLELLLIVVGFILLLWYMAPLPAFILNIGNAVGMAGSVLLILFGFYFDKISGGWRNGILIFIAVVLAVIVAPLSFNMARYADYKTDAGAETVIV
ncbi:MAG: hypothetical protein K2K71_04400, partial [Eubacterium sp.]|nr:hypothetical protein [Eubacterium sp.]